MVQVKNVLDKRRQKSDGTYSIIFRITNIKKTYAITSGISIHESVWGEVRRQVYKTHPKSQTINATLSKKYYLIQKSIIKLEEKEAFIMMN